MPAALRPVRGKDQVARRGRATVRRDGGLTVAMVPVNGEPGYLLKRDHAIVGVGMRRSKPFTDKANRCPPTRSGGRWPGCAENTTASSATRIDQQAST